jgi:hypothetical protein
MIDDNDDDKNVVMFVIRPSAIQVEKRILGKAQAWCSRSVANSIMKTSEFDIRNKTPPGATETSHLTSRSCSGRRRHSSQPLQSAGQIFT